MRGRPKEGRIRVNWHVLPETVKAIKKLVNRIDKRMSSAGRVVESRFPKEKTK